MYLPPVICQFAVDGYGFIGPHLFSLRCDSVAVVLLGLYVSDIEKYVIDRMRFLF